MSGVTSGDLAADERSDDSLPREHAVLAGLADLTRHLVAETLSTEDTGSLVLRCARSLTGSEHGYVSYVDPATGENVTHTFTEMMAGGECGHAGELLATRSGPDPDGTYPCLRGVGLDSRRPFYTNDPSAHPSAEGTPEGHVPIRSFLSVPAVSGDRLLGQVALANAPGGYSDDDLDVVQRVTDLYAVALIRIEAQAALPRETRLLRQAERVARLASWRMTLGSGRLIWSEGMNDLFGVPADAFGKGEFDELVSLLHPDDRPIVLEVMSSALADGIPRPPIEFRIVRPDGEVRWLQAEGTRETDQSGRVVALSGYVQDVTGRRIADDAVREANEDLRKAARALRTLSAAGQALVRATDEARLLQDVCDVAVDEGGYRGAVVFFAEHDEDESFRAIASSGFPEGYFTERARQVSWGDNARGQGPSGLAIRSRAPSVVADTETAPGWTRWLEVSRAEGYRSVISLPLFGPDGEPFGVFGIYAFEPNAFDAEEIVLLEGLAADLSYGLESLEREARRAAAETALRLSENRFSTAFQTSPDAITISRLSDGMYIDVNAGYTRTSGYSDEEVLCKTPEELPALISPPDVAAMAERLANDGILHDYEARCPRKDGTIATILFSASLIEIQGETCVLRIGHDITERKRAEDALRQSETKYRVVADFTYDWEAWRSPDGRLVWVSPSCERITGYPPDAFMSDPDLTLRIVHDDDRERMASHFGRVLPGPPETMEYRIVTRGGETRWMEHVCRPVFDDLGGFLGRRGSDRDVSERKRVERAQEDFLAVVSHELRTPLTAIIGFASLLQRDDAFADPETARRSLARIAERGEAMRGLVEELLQVTQLSADSLRELEWGRVDVEQMVVACIASLGPHVQERVRLTVCGDVGELECDASRVSIAVSNLLSNADKFSPEGDPINVTASRAGGGVAIVVSDRGIGMKSDQCGKVFERFWQADMSPTRAYSGIGLGLFIVRQIIEAHGGTVGVRSRTGEGSVFRIWIPDRPSAEKGLEA
jgi:PAS domain S-box-containing protein